MSRLLCLLAAVLLLPISDPVPARSAGAEVLDTVNWARLRGCAFTQPRSALRDSASLSRAALSVSRGSALREALAEEDYPASESIAIHLSGALDAAQVARALTTGYCSTLGNARLTEAGAQRRGAQVWILLAAAVAVPRQADAQAVSRLMLERVNAVRAAGRRCGSRYFAPVAPLTLNSALSRAALAHSADMALHGQFDHRGHDGSTPSDRVRSAGYGAYRIVGENIAAGAMSPSEAADGWLASPAHCENIMDARFSEMGFAFAQNGRSQAAIYWTEDFAAPK